MKEQPTTELLDILNNIDKKDMSAYIKEFAATASAAAPFPEYIAEHGIAIADVVHRCRGILSKSYVYDILNGTKRNPSRDVVLLLCIAVHADRKQTRRLLEKYGHRDLYAKDKEVLAFQPLELHGLPDTPVYLIFFGLSPQQLVRHSRRFRGRTSAG